ncbi:hypothetical protein ABBQ32_011079 [Trebouxia sp. C0010 RCD-2024]
MLCIASSSDWTDQLGGLLHDIAAVHERRRDYTWIKNVRLVCKAWLLAANSSRRFWSPIYGCTSERVRIVAQNYSRLTHVDLSALHSRYVPVDLEPLLQLGSIRQLHAGNFAICVPSTASRALEQMTNLADLNLCPLGNLGLLKLSQLCNLTSLSVRGPEVYTSPGGEDCYENEAAGQEILQQAASLSQLQSICLSRLALNDAACKAIYLMTQLQSLSLLEVIHTAYIRPRHKKLEDNVRTEASQAAFNAVCALEQLSQLAMPESLVYLTSLNSISKLTNLTSLDMQCFPNIRSLAGLEKLIKVQSLNVSDLIHVPSLSVLQNLRDLRELRFARCIAVQSWGVQTISLLTKLEVLDMQCCAFSSSWITLLTGLTSLHNLDMSVGNWRDQDVLQLTRCTALSYLGLRDCPSTTSSMHRILRERLPRLAVIEAQCNISGDQYAGFLGWPY